MRRAGTRAVGAVFVGVVLTLASGGIALADLPLVTDDTDTQGQGRFQIEASGGYSHDRESGLTEEIFEFKSIITYGVIDPVDLVLTVPYQRTWSKGWHQHGSAGGFSDISLEVKWRFWEDRSLGLSFAAKPGVLLPAGDEKHGFGAGRTNFSLFFVASEEIEPWEFHLNLGYIRNENRVDERRDIWHASLAAEWEFVKDLKLVGDLGIETNTCSASNQDLAFIIGGIIYSVTEDFDIDLGVKGGLTKPEPDHTFLAGVTWRF